MPSSERPHFHIVGAGLAGLAAAVRLAEAGHALTVHEATAQAGGRCRTYQDHSTGMSIDNGTHLVLSGNRALLSFAETIGSQAELQGPATAEFAFVDLASNERWKLQFSDGRFPWWVFDKDRRLPQTAFTDYLPLARLLLSSADKPLGEVMNCTGPTYDRLIAPLLLAALNIEPRQGSAGLARAVVRETLALGGKACRPLLARNGIGNVFVEPAVSYLRQRSVSILLEDELRAVHLAGGRIKELEFTDRRVSIAESDAVILAVPPYAAQALLPDLTTPTQFRGIVNAHFRVDPPAHLPPMLGVINGTCEWIFAHPGRISVTVSDAGRLFEMPRADLAATLWREVAQIARISDVLPPWQIVRERRATFAATPEQNARRPSTETGWCNLFLAGDWTATGLPATLEGAVRSGYRAAELADNSVRVAA
jgi:squalene-associated FAD-dependent desaturase